MLSVFLLAAGCAAVWTPSTAQRSTTQKSTGTSSLAAPVQAQAAQLEQHCSAVRYGEVENCHVFFVNGSFCKTGKVTSRNIFDAKYFIYPKSTISISSYITIFNSSSAYCLDKYDINDETRMTKNILTNSVWIDISFKINASSKLLSMTIGNNSKICKTLGTNNFFSKSDNNSTLTIDVFFKGLTYWSYDCKPNNTLLEVLFPNVLCANPFIIVSAMTACNALLLIFLVFMSSCKVYNKVTCFKNRHSTIVDKKQTCCEDSTLAVTTLGSTINLVRGSQGKGAAQRDDYRRQQDVRASHESINSLYSEFQPPAPPSGTCAETQRQNVTDVSVRKADELPTTVVGPGAVREQRLQSHESVNSLYGQCP